MTADEEQGSSSKTPTLHGTHRLPTLSATQALANARSRGPRTISTGLKQLDAQLLLKGQSNSDSASGIAVGQVTEIFGPPGSGKTSFGLQLCYSAIQQGGRAVWIDTASPIAHSRLQSLPNAAQQDDEINRRRSVTESLRMFQTSTLPHLLALLFHSTSFPGEAVRVVVIDAISTPIERAYGRHGQSTSNSEATKWAAGRKFVVMGEVIRRLGKLAVMHDLAVVLLSQCATRLRQGAPAILLPTISSQEWEAGVSSRIVVYRDWPLSRPHEASEADGTPSSTHFVAAQKVGGFQADSDKVVSVPFVVTLNGLAELSVTSIPRSAPDPSSPVRHTKRNYVEIADSDAEDLGSDDDYSWMNEEDVVANDSLLTDQPVAQGDQPRTIPVTEEWIAMTLQ